MGGRASCPPLEFGFYECDFIRKKGLFLYFSSFILHGIATRSRRNAFGVRRLDAAFLSSGRAFHSEKESGVKPPQSKMSDYL